MTLEKGKGTNEAELIAHIVILEGIISVLPKEKAENVKTHAINHLNHRIELESEKESPSTLLIDILESAKSKAINLFPKG